MEEKCNKCGKNLSSFSIVMADFMCYDCREIQKEWNTFPSKILVKLDTIIMELEKSNKQSKESQEQLRECQEQLRECQEQSIEFQKKSMDTSEKTHNAILSKMERIKTSTEVISAKYGRIGGYS